MRSANFTSAQIAALPLGAATYMRSFDELALLVAGVAPPPFTPGVRGPGVGFGIGSAGQFAVNGQRARANNFSIDGTDNNDTDVGVRRAGYVAQAPQAPESVEQVSVATLLWNAELGRSIGSQVNAVTKYGGDAWHGALNGLVTDSRLNARNFFDYAGGPSAGENPFTRTQLAAAAGGPIVRERTQLFVGFEGNKTNASVEEHFSVPSQDARDALLTTVPRARTILSLPPRGTPGDYSLYSPDVSTRIPLREYPAPNQPGGLFGANTFTRVLPADGDGLIGSARLTHQLSAGTSLHLNVSGTGDRRVLPSVNQAIGSTIGARSTSRRLSAIADSQLGGGRFNQARFAWGATRIGFPEHPLGPLNPTQFYAIFNLVGFCSYSLSNGGQVCASPSFIGGVIQPIGEVTIHPYSSVGVNSLLFPQGRRSQVFQYADTLVWHRRAHTMRFGVDLRRVHLDNFQDRLYRPLIEYGYGLRQFGAIEYVQEGAQLNYRFTPQGRPQAVSSLGLEMLAPTSVLQTLTAGPADSRVRLRNTEVAGFFHDSWQARAGLSLDFGLRYEFNSVPRDADGRIEQALSLRNLPQPGPTTTAANLSRYQSLLAGYAAVLGGRTTIYDPDANNLGLRIGFAWAPNADSRTVLRGGYGLYFDAALGAVISQSRNVFPNQIPLGIGSQTPGSILFPADCRTVICRTVNQFFQIPSTQLKGGEGEFINNIGTLANEIRAGLAFILPARDLPMSYAQQWHLTLERELGGGLVVSAAYLGTRGGKLTRLTTPNLGAQSTPTVQMGDAPLSFPGPAQAFLPSVLLNSFTLLNPARRPTPGIGAYQLFENTAGSIYHALQLEAATPLGGGRHFTAAYAWSHAIDDVSDIFPIAGAPVLAQNQRALRADRASANFDLRHRFSLSLVQDLSALGKALGGWQAAIIAQAQSGHPFTLNLPFDANLDGNLSDRPATMAGLTLNGVHDRQRVALAPGTPLESFYTLGQDGEIGRNTLRGDRFLNLDLAVMRAFRVAGDRSLTVRAEAFNLFNRANFGLPVRILDAPAFGAATETVNPARVLQIGLKFSF